MRFKTDDGADLTWHETPKSNAQEPYCLRDPFAIGVSERHGHFRKPWARVAHPGWSLIIPSNLVFSHWDRIFESPMTMQAVIDRLVHHATIIEVKRRTSVRAEEAKRRNAALEAKD